MMARHLALILAGVFSVSLVSVFLPEPAQAVCRPHCLDLNKKRGDVRDFDRGDRWNRGDRGERGKRHHYGWAKHQFHKKHKHGSHRGHGGHDVPPVGPGEGGGSTGGGDTGGGSTGGGDGGVVDPCIGC